MKSSLTTINSIARAQHGLVASWQLRDAGITKRRIEVARENGTLIPTLRGVYRTPGTPKSWEATLMETVLFCGPGSAVSHRAAARLHGLIRTSPIIEVCTPRRRRAHGLPDDTTVHTSVILPKSDIMMVAGIPTSTVERTLIDLGAVQSERRVAHALDTALRTGLTDIGLLRYVHARRRGRGRRGAGVLARVLEQHLATGTTESPYERDLVHALMDRGLELPRLQYEITALGTFIARVDLAWPRSRLVVEVDGHGFHSDRDQRAHDARRQNSLIQAGWTVLRFTTDQIHEDLPAVVFQIRESLRSCDG